MAVNTAEALPINEAGLIEAINEFVSFNSHSRHVENRWLCTVLEPLIPTISQVKSGSLQPDTRKLVNVFRAAELQKEIEAKRREVEVLARELTKCQAA